MQANKGKGILTGGAGVVSALAVAVLWVVFGRSLRRRFAPEQSRRPLHDGGTQNAEASSTMMSTGERPQLHEDEGRVPRTYPIYPVEPHGTEPASAASAEVVLEPGGGEQRSAVVVAEHTSGNGHEGDAGLRHGALATLVSHDDVASEPEQPVEREDPVDLVLPPVAEEKRGRNLRPILIEIVQTVLLTLIIFAGVRSVVQNFKVDGASMEPTLHTGQYLLINKVAYAKLDGLSLEVAQRIGIAPPDTEGYYPFGGPQRGDIAVFQYPGGPERDFIKRVIALPGDTVQIERGRVSVNGVLLDENYIRAVPSYSVPPQIVPDGQYYVLGDNRPNSSDSHIWGFVPADNMIGKAWVSYWPPSDWGAVANHGIAAH